MSIAPDLSSARYRAAFTVLLVIATCAALTATLADEAPDDAETIRGRVTDEAGQPLADATVRVLAEGLSSDRRALQSERWRDPIVVVTDAQGNFSAGPLSGEAFTVRARGPALSPTTVESIPPGAWLSLHLQAGHAVQGRVVASAGDSAVGGATVLACDTGAFDFGLDACIVATTDAAGEFVVHGLPAGDLQLRAHASGHAVSKPVALVVPAGDPAGSPVTLKLAPGARVTGRIVDDERQAVAGARVYARLLELKRDAAAVAEGWPVHSDTAGTFVFEGLPANVRLGLLAYRSDRGLVDGGTVRVEPGADLTGIEIVLPATSAVTFRLVDENDLPLDAFDLHFREATTTSGDWLGPLDPTGIERGAEGRVTARIPASGSYDLRLAPEGFEEIELAEVVLERGQTTDLDTLVARHGLTVRGRIADEQDEPIEYATVEASWAEGGFPRTKRALTDDDGRYALVGLVDTAVRVEASAAGFVSESVDSVVPGEEEVDLTLRPTGGLTGRVALVEGGTPEAFMIVLHVEATSDVTTPEHYAEFPRKDSFSTEDGEYRLDDLPPGRFTVEARSLGRAPGRRSGVRVTHGEVAEVPLLELGKGLTLEGRVVALEDDSPVAGVALAAEGQGGSLVAAVSAPRQAAASDEDGHFLLEGLEPGSLVVSAEHPEFAPASERVALTEDDDPPDLLLRLARGGTLSGVVRDADGNPAPARRIVVTRDLRDEDDLQAAVTDADGSYELTRLAPGAYVVNLVPQPGGRLRMNVRSAVIREAEVTLLDFDESSPITLTGTVYRDGQPLGRAQLFFAKTISLTDFKFSSTDGAGHYEVGLDEPGRYRVIVQTGSTSASGGASTEITVPDLEHSGQDIHLGTDGVSGTVQDPDGHPVTGAVVSATAAAGDSSAGFLVAETGLDGRYTIQGIDPGVYRVTATSPGFKVATAYPVELAEGGGVVTVDFALEPGGTLHGRLVDDFGNGIAGAAVLVAPAGSVDPWGGGAATSVTDVNGSFSLTTPGDGPLDVTALPGGWAPVRLRGVVPPTGDEDLLLRAGRGGSLRVVVVDVEGSPQRGVMLIARPVPPFLGSELAGLLTPPVPTDAAGAILFSGLAPGGYAVTVNGRDDVPPASVTIQPDSETLLRLELP